MQKILSYVRRAVEDYDMIQEGDKISVGVSGGKDSLTAMIAMHELSKFYPKKFTVCAISIDMGFDNMDFTPVKKLCDDLGIEYILKKREIKEIIFDIRKESNPCSLCAKMRRGALNNLALEAGSNKIVLGHHNDDVLETFFLSLFYEGRISCFAPVTYLDRTKVYLLRPMIYVPEKVIRGYVKNAQLPVVHNTCPNDGHSKRQYMKDLILKLDRENKDLKKHMFTAVKNGKIDGWDIIKK